MPSAKHTPNYGLTQYDNTNNADKMAAADWTKDNQLIDTALNDNATNIADKADKTYVDSQDANLQKNIDVKADTTYVDSQDAKLQKNIDAKANTADVYNKTDADAKFATQENTYTKKEVDDSQAAQDKVTQTLNRGVDQNYNVLCCYFLSQSERLHYAVSSDGLNYSHPYIRKNDDGETVRDPSCIYIAGQVYFCWTRPTAAGGGAFGTTNTIGIGQLNPTTGAIAGQVITPTLTDITQLWAPDFYLEGTTLYIIFSVKTKTQDFQPYEIHATSNYSDPTSWSIPTALGIAPYGGIDHHIIKDDTGLYHDLSADGSIISHRSSKTLIGGWSGRETVDKDWRYLEAPTSYRLANGNWRVFLDGGGLQGDYNPGSNIQETDGLMFYSDFSNDLSTHGPLYPVPTAMRHCGLTLIPSDYIAAQTRLEVGSNIGGAFLSNSVDIKVVVDSAGKNVRALFDKFDGFGGLKNTGFGGTQKTTEGFIVGNSGLYVLSASISYLCDNANTWLNAVFTRYPQRDNTKVENIGIGGQSSMAPDNTKISTVVLPPVLAYLNANDQIQIKVSGLDGNITQRANNSYFTAFKIA